MKVLIAAVVSGVFLLLGALHFYWAAGGRWGKRVAIPQRGAEPLFHAGAGPTLGVGVLLMAAAVVAAGRLRSWEIPAINTLTLWGNWLLAVVFALRAIGDFRWAGFFKRVRGTPFAEMDTRLYSPLCLLLSMGCLYIALH
jgi:hypothetical protein